MLPIKKYIATNCRQDVRQNFPCLRSARMLSRISFLNKSPIDQSRSRCFSTSRCYFSHSWQLFQKVSNIRHFFPSTSLRGPSPSKHLFLCLVRFILPRKRNIQLQWSTGFGIFGVVGEGLAELIVRCSGFERRKRCPFSKLSWTQWLCSRQTTKTEK